MKASALRKGHCRGEKRQEKIEQYTESEGETGGHECEANVSYAHAEVRAEPGAYAGYDASALGAHESFVGYGGCFGALHSSIVAQRRTLAQP